MIKLIYLNSALKCDSFIVAIYIKIPFFWVLVTIEPGRSLLQFVTTNCLKKISINKKRKNAKFYISIFDTTKTISVPAEACWKYQMTG